MISTNSAIIDHNIYFEDKQIKKNKKENERNIFN